MVWVVYDDEIVIYEGRGVVGKNEEKVGTRNSYDGVPGKGVICIKSKKSGLVSRGFYYGNLHVKLVIGIGTIFSSLAPIAPLATIFKSVRQVYRNSRRGCWVIRCYVVI